MVVLFFALRKIARFNNDRLAWFLFIQALAGYFFLSIMTAQNQISIPIKIGSFIFFLTAVIGTELYKTRN